MTKNKVFNGAIYYNYLGFTIYNPEVDQFWVQFNLGQRKALYPNLLCAKSAINMWVNHLKK